MSRTVDAYLSISSPFSYLAMTRLPEIEARCDCRFSYHLIDLARVWQLSGNPGPLAVGPKLDYLVTDALRWAEYYDVPFNLPEQFVFDNNPAARLYQAVREQGDGLSYIEHLMTGYWVEGRNFSRQELLLEAAATAGLELGRAAAALEDTRLADAVVAEAEEAVGRGVFGVPTFVVDGELYWGNDRLEMLERHLRRTPG